MGGDYYDRDVYQANDTVYNTNTTNTVSYSSASTKAVGTTTKMHSSMDPQRWKDEKLISTAKNPIIFALDVTGSMGDWTRIIYDKMPMFYGQIMMQNYLPDPAISFCAVGDYTCDEAPLQITEFGQGKSIDQLLGKMFLEGGGGGSHQESYELAAYFYSNFVELEDSDLPFFFITGDEAFYEQIKEKYITKIIGKSPNENFVNSREAWKALMTKYNVFLIKKSYDEERKEKIIKAQWEETIGEERVLYISNPKACIDVMLGAIALTSGHRDMEGYVTDMKNRGQDTERIQEVMAALEKYAEKLVKYKLQVKSNNNSKDNVDSIKVDVENLNLNSGNNNQGMINTNTNTNTTTNTNFNNSNGLTTGTFNLNEFEERKKQIREDMLKALEDEDEDKLKIREDLIAMKKVFGSVPEQLICPITGDIFVDPVMTSDGHTYERKAIEAWFDKHKTSPVTNLSLDNKNLIPNFVIKQLVRGFYDDNIELISK